MKTKFYDLGVTGCSDGACIFQDNSKGMHTNGGCGCCRNQHKVLRALNTQDQQIESLRATISRLRAELEHAREERDSWRGGCDWRDAEITRLRVELAECKEALRDCASGLRYIADTYGKLYGVGWERALGKAKRAITGAGDKP